MRSYFLALGLCASLLTTSGCGRKEPAPPPSQDPGAATEAPPASEPAPPTPAAPAPLPPTANAPASIETASAAVLVRVAFGDVMQREYGGVILKPDTFTPPIADDSDRRFVAVWIPDYEGRDLQDQSCKIGVFRTPPTEPDAGRNNDRHFLRDADLVEFDESSRIALVRFIENLPYRLDGGVKAGQGQPPHHALVAAFKSRPLPASFPAPDSATQPPSAALAGLAIRQDRAVINEAGTLAGIVPATLPLLSEAGNLTRFARLSKDGGPLSAPFQTPSLDTRPLLFQVQDVQTTVVRDNETRLRITGKLRDPLGQLSTWRGSYKRIADPKEFEQALADENFKLAKESSVYPSLKNGHLECQLPNMLSRDSAGPVHALVQLRAALKKGNDEYFTKPFLITLTPKGTLVEATVNLGTRAAPAAPPAPPPSLPAAAPIAPEPQASHSPAVPPAAPATAAELKRVKTESPIVAGFSICGGREVLLNLSGAPYWKRLSLETGDWLPLPDMDLVQVRLTGNKEALFALDPATRTVRRFNAATLKQEAEQQLPEKAAWIAIAAGCNTQHAPLAIVSPNGVLALSPHDLSLIHDGVSSERPINPASDKVRYVLSADGLNLFHFRPESGMDQPTIYKSYLGGVKGFSDPVWHVKTSPSPVSAAFGWSSMGFQARLGLLKPSGQQENIEVLDPPTAAGVKKAIPLPSAPLWLEVTTTSHPSLPSTHKGALRSFVTQERFIELDLPELGELAEKFHTSLQNRVFFHPGAPALATWHGSDTVTIRQLKPTATLPTKLPVLLNFPEAVIPRGSTWTFKPVFFGPTAATLEMTGTPDAERSPDGTLSWNPPDGLPVSSYQIAFRLGPPSATTPGVEFNMPVLFHGGGRVTAAPPHLDPGSIESLRKGAQRGEVTKTRLVPLASRAFHSPRPVARVHQGLNDYLLLEMQDKSLALLSLSDLQIKGSVTLSPATRFFPAGESLLTFDAERGLLSRLSLPGLTPAANLKMPLKTEVVGIAAGENADSVVTLLVQQRLMQGNDVRERSRNVLFLEKATLQRGPWASLSPSNEKDPNGGWSNDTPVSLRGGEYREGPQRMPCSLDGRTVLLPSGLLAISNAMTIGVQATGSAGSDFANLVTTASPTADRLFVMGNMTTPTTAQAFRIGGLSDAKIMSRCGNYLVAPVQTGEVRAVTIESTEGFRPLLTLTGIDALELKDVQFGRVQNNFPCIPFGEKNLLVCMSPGGTVIQLIDLNLPDVVKQVSPDTVVVTSHVRPYVLRGGTLQYQVTVNNPDAVTSYRLRDTVPGATISPEGMLVFKAPADGAQDKTRNIAIEVVLKAGGVVVHEIGIAILPTTTMPMPTKPANPNSI